MTTGLLLAIAAALAQVPGEPAGAQTKPAMEVGPRYTADLQGFSICPPLGAQRLHEPSVKRLVGWVRRDEKTGAIRWSMEVLKNRHKPSQMPAAEYAKVVAAELAKKEHFKIEDIEISVVAARPAMHFRGVWSAAVELWRRQTWVLLGPEEHLVLDVAGRMEDKAEMEAALTASVRTLRLLDPSEAIAERSRNIAHGAEALKKVDPEKLRRLLADKTQYFLVKQKGRTVGFMKITEAIAERAGARGLWVVRSGCLKLPERPRQLIHEDMFATADRSVELWRSASMAGKGASAVGPIVHEAVKQQNLLLVHAWRPRQARKTRQFVLPPPIRPAYLPAALAAVLPRLLDTSTPSAYGFAVYNVDAADFHLRTVRVVGPGQIVLDDKKVAAVHLTDQMSQDATPVDVWVDQKQLLLRMGASEGLMTSRADRRAVVAAFADELVELKKLEKK